MTKEILYTYLGTNGTITTPIHLEDIYYTRSIRLIADRKKKLTSNGGKTLLSSVIVPEDEVNLWTEVDE
jgi:hypothetical protein